MDPMDSDENGHLDNKMSVDSLVPSKESANSDHLHGHDIFPRLGANYQVEIPELVQRSEYLLLLGNVENSESGGIEYLVGLPIPVLVTSQEHKSTKVERTRVRRSSNPSKRGRVETANTNIDPMSVRLPDEPVIKPGDSNYSFVPLSVTGSWTDLERSSFLLGLYIFEKNFVHLRRFIETKHTGEVMSFYYGTFYRTQEYFRWSESRKMKSRRCVFGQKIFTGLRQQEFLSRIINNVSVECKNALLEVSKTFVEGKMPLEEYVFSLKTMVGMSMLVEAVGIGKGKQDLTGMALEPLRSNQSAKARPEIPVGKACSQLTPSEIVKFLTGDYRLSKARSNDLFWEAVWPRLLARGWHSEEPKDLSYTVSSKNPLVFLVPGVKKFSRRKLVKGNHFFDSVTDVLSKVALEPGLIELETEDGENKRNKEVPEGKNNGMVEDDDVSSRRRRFYLQPRHPNRGAEKMKFTVVDSSIGGGKGPVHRLKELSSPLREYSGEFNPPGNYFGLSEENTPPELSEGANTTVSNRWEINTVNTSIDLVHGEILSDMITAPKLENDAPYPTSVIRVNSSRTALVEKKRPRKEVKKRQLPQRTKNNGQNTSPVNKRARKLTVCKQLEKSAITASSAIFPAMEAKLPMQMHTINIGDFAESIRPQVSSPNKLHLSNESKGSHDESVECDTVNYPVVSDPQENSQTQPLIDLNIPQVPADFENDVFMADAPGSKVNNLEVVNGAPEPPALKVVTSEPQQPNVNQQRRGTRNRPPTSRALEALANGFLTVNSRKSKDGSSRTRSTSRARGNAGRGSGMQTPHQPNLESAESRSEFSTSVSSTLQGSPNVAGTDSEKVVHSEFEVISPDSRPPKTSGN